MTKMLLREDGLIISIGSIIEFGEWDEPGVLKWKIGKYSYTLDDNYTAVEIESVPIDVVPNKYFFIDGVFIPNPNYSDPNEQDKLIKELNDRVEEHELSQAETELDIDARLISLELGLI